MKNRPVKKFLFMGLATIFISLWQVEGCEISITDFSPRSIFQMTFPTQSTNFNGGSNMNGHITASLARLSNNTIQLNNFEADMSGGYVYDRIDLFIPSININNYNRQLFYVINPNIIYARYQYGQIVDAGFVNDGFMHIEFDQKYKNYQLIAHVENISTGVRLDLNTNGRTNGMCVLPPVANSLGNLFPKNSDEFLE